MSKNTKIFLTCIALAALNLALGSYQQAASYVAASLVIAAMEGA